MSLSVGHRPLCYGFAMAEFGVATPPGAVDAVVLVEAECCDVGSDLTLRFYAGEKMVVLFGPGEWLSVSTPDRAAVRGIEPFIQLADGRWQFLP